MKKLLGIIAVAMLMVVGAQAQVILNQNFNSFTNGNLVGQGTWVQTGTTATSPVQVAGGAVGPTVQGSAQDVSISLSSPVTSGSFYYGVDFSFTSKNASSDYFLHIANTNAGTGFSSRLYAQSSGLGFALAWGGSSTAPTAFGAELAFNTTYRAVMRYDIVSGLVNDTGALYITTGAFDSVEANNTTYQNVTTWAFGTEQTAFGAFNIRQGTNTGVYTIDNVLVGTTFASAAIPEPSTYALLGLGLGALWFLRRKKHSAKA